jgi:hypothetical protein
MISVSPLSKSLVDIDKPRPKWQLQQPSRFRLPLGHRSGPQTSLSDGSGFPRSQIETTEPMHLFDVFMEKGVTLYGDDKGVIIFDGDGDDEI